MINNTIYSNIINIKYNVILNISNIQTKQKPKIIPIFNQTKN